MQKNKNKLIQKQNARDIHFKVLLISYVELENRLRAMEEKFSTNESENI